MIAGMGVAGPRVNSDQLGVKPMSTACIAHGQKTAPHINAKLDNMGRPRQANQSINESQMTGPRAEWN
jgi:hypothetical protein